MAGINLQGGAGAGAAVDALRVLVAEQLRAKTQADQVAQEQARLAELSREADQRNVVDLGHLGVAKTHAQLQAERDAQAKRHSELFDPLDYRQKEASIAGTQATTAATTQNTQQGGVKFGQAQQDRTGTQNLIGALPEGPLRNAVNLQFLGGLKVTPDEMRTPEQRGQDTEAQATAAWLGGGKKRYAEQQGIQASFSPKSEKMVAVIDPGTGDTINVPESQSAGMTPVTARRVLGQERQSLAYFNRAKEADKITSQLEDQIGKMGTVEQGYLKYAPNFMQTQLGQSYRQAQRAFTEARLRKESGAAIPTAEYENDSKTYFGQPGDSEETIKQKRQQRAEVLDGLGFSSGQAYNEFYGEPFKRNAPSAGGGRVQVKDPTGKTGTVSAEDAKNLPSGWVIIK